MDWTVCIDAPAHLEEDLELLRLRLLQDGWLQMFEYGHAHVNLVVGTHQHTGGNVVADFCPVQIVPEALSQPVEANLWYERQNIIVM